MASRCEGKTLLTKPGDFVVFLFLELKRVWKQGKLQNTLKLRGEDTRMRNEDEDKDKEDEDNKQCWQSQEYG